MLHYQVSPDVALVDHAPEIDAFLEMQRLTGDADATRYHLEHLPPAATALRSVKCVLPALVYLPNRCDTPPSLAIAPASALNSGYLHENLKTAVRTKQKNRSFRGAPVTSALIADDRDGRHLFLDDDVEDVTKYQTDGNRKAFKELYGIDMVQAGDEFEESGLSVVGIVRVISEARKKAVLKREFEDVTVNRFLMETFATLARSGKTSDVYQRLVRENEKYRRQGIRGA